MTMDSERTAHGEPGAPPPVPPALVVRIAMRPMTRLLNPLIARLAGRRHFRMAALVRHVGRRSGRTYQTPVGCSIRLDGSEYVATMPEFLSRQQTGADIRSAFSPVERAGFRMLGIRQFLRLRIVPAGI